MTKILIVDDYPDSMTLLEHRLSLTGYEVTTTNLVSKAMVLLEEETFDLVISDVVMPGMNGVEFMNLVSELPGQLKTIFMSGTSSQTTIDNLMRLGAFGFLPKPVDFVELEQLIVEALGMVNENNALDGGR